MYLPDHAYFSLDRATVFAGRCIFKERKGRGRSPFALFLAVVAPFCQMATHGDRDITDQNLSLASLIPENRPVAGDCLAPGPKSANLFAEGNGTKFWKHVSGLHTPSTAVPYLRFRLRNGGLPIRAMLADKTTRWIESFLTVRKNGEVQSGFSAGTVCPQPLAFHLR